jgi:small subunit ribosomal protein S4
MGDPKKKHKKYSTPKRPYAPDFLLEELRLVGGYGLRNKKELWRARTELSAIRRHSRNLLSLTINERADRENKLVSKLHKMGLVGSNANLEDILSLNIEDLLERRLQTIIWRRNMAHTLYQARQMVTHGHISINGRRVTTPGYHVMIDDEKTLDYSPYSSYADSDHPLRKELAFEEGGGTQIE